MKMAEKMDGIEAKELRIGKGVRICEGVRISGGINYKEGKSVPAEKVIIGDGAYLGHNVEIECPYIEIGDYTMIRENSQIIGHGECRIGSCCWIGQYCILNTHGGLYIGNGVGIGAHSQLWGSV